MKKLLFSMLFFPGLVALQAQDAEGLASAVLSPTRVIKTNLVGYALVSVNANFEQKVGTKTSVGLLGGYKIPTTYRLDAIGKLDGEDQTYTGDITPEGLFLNPYFRFYTGKGAMTGFYLEAFTRYYNYTFGVPYDYDKNDRRIRANLDGSANGFGGGLGLGVQLALAKRLYLDINSGFGMASGSVHLETNDPNLDAADYQKIKRNIEDNVDDADIQILFLGNTISGLEANASSNSAWGDIKNKAFPITRFGIAIGYAF